MRLLLGALGSLLVGVRWLFRCGHWFGNFLLFDLLQEAEQFAVVGVAVQVVAVFCRRLGRWQSLGLRDFGVGVLRSGLFGLAAIGTRIGESLSAFGFGRGRDLVGSASEAVNPLG